MHKNILIFSDGTGQAGAFVRTRTAPTSTSSTGRPAATPRPVAWLATLCSQR